MSLWIILLADGARSEQFAKGFREGNLTRTPYHVLLSLAATVLAITVVFYAIELFRKSRSLGPVNNDRQLFRELCRIHHLDRRSIRQLQAIARRENLTNAAEVFVRPELLQEPEQTGLRDRLFGSLSS